MSAFDGETGGFGPAFIYLFCCLGMLILAVLVPLVPLGMAPGMAVLAVLSTGFLFWRRRRLPVPDRHIVVALGLFLAWSGISLFWTAAGHKGAVSYFSFLYLWLPALLLLSVLDMVPEGTARRIAGLLLMATAVGCALFAIELLADQPIQRFVAPPEKSAVDYERDINRAALLLALLTGPVTLLVWRLGWRLPAAIALILPLLMALDSTSQSAVAALLGLLVLLGIAVVNWRVATGLVAAGILAGFAFCGPIAQWMHAIGLSQATWMPLSFRHRIMTWDFVAGHLGDHPWIGWGLDASRAIPGGDGYFPGTSSPGWPGWRVLPMHPHNLFLQVRLELGWVGAVLATLLLLAILRRLTLLEPGIRPMAIALFGAAIFTQCFAYGAWQGWLICGMLFAGALVTLAGRIRAPS